MTIPQTDYLKLNCWNNQIKTAYTFLRKKSKILPIKQQPKWCEILQIPPESINWKKIYENNYFSTIETKLRSFQIRLNLRSLVMNVQLAGFGIIDSELCSFCLEKLETIMHFFWSVNLLSPSGMTLEIGFPQNCKSTLSCLEFINYLVFKKTVLIINF